MHTRAASVEVLAAAAEDQENCWRLIGFGALTPLLLAAAVPPAPGEPPLDQLARRALCCLRYDEAWRGASCDPLSEARAAATPR